MHDTQNPEFTHCIAQAWDGLRKDCMMLLDAPYARVSLPWVEPYEGVRFHVQNATGFCAVAIPTDQAAKFAAAILEAVEESKRLDAECDAQIAAVAPEFAASEA